MAKQHTDDALIEAFTEAAFYLKRKVEGDGWVWTSNFLREYVRARHHMRFGNELSPRIMDAVISRHPGLGAWIKVRARDAE